MAQRLSYKNNCWCSVALLDYWAERIIELSGIRTVAQVQCDLPLCPVPEDIKASGLDAASSKSQLLTSNVTRKAGTQLQYRCVTPREKFWRLKKCPNEEITNDQPRS